jgi:hypothetical protein
MMDCVRTILDEVNVSTTQNDGRPPLGTLETDDKNTSWQPRIKIKDHTEEKLCP